MVFELNEPKPQLQISLEEYEQYIELRGLRLYLTTGIESSDSESDGYCMSIVMQMVNDIMSYNRYDAEHKIPVEERTPIKIYINSPGGEVTEGFALVSAIEVSKTPIYTINIGQWCSMAFLIGIAGHKRFSLPKMTFLMHDGTSFAFDSSSKAHDKMKFNERFDNEVIKAHVLKHSNMKPSEYDALSRVEYYMLPEDALERNFIDEIVTDINTIL